MDGSASFQLSGMNEQQQQQQQQQGMAAHNGAFTHFQHLQPLQHEADVGQADFMDDQDGSGEGTPGPVASTSKSGTSMTLKKKTATSGGGGSSKKGTKRPRPTLSCTECVRRKSKCDRVIPCSTCIKRGSPDRCRVDDDLDRPSQPFAQARELALVKERVARLEQLLLAIAPEKAKAVLGAEAGQRAGRALNNQAGSSVQGGRADNSDSEMDEDDEGEEGGEAEKAAFALESIAVAGRAPMSFEGGGDMDALPLTSQAKLRESQLRQQEVDFLMSMLPDWTLSRDLVDAFFTKVAWQNHIVHVPTFEAQYSGLRELVDQRRISEIDPAWLSLYFMVLACGLFFSPNRTDMPASHQAEYTHTWVLGAQRALQLADWSGRPQLTCIQSVVLFPVVLMHAGGIKRLSSWIAAAMRMAQLLDLHKLDDKNAAVRRSGAAAGFTPVEREIGKRLYFSLTHGEVNFASRWLGIEDSQSSHPSSIPNLLNVDDTDLLASPPIPKSIEVATASSFQVIRARITTQDFTARLTGSDARVHKYESVLAFDQRTRQLLDSLPAYFKYDRSDDPDIKAIAASRPYIAYQRCVILYGLNNRLLRAHRPFMSRGYHDQKFAYSTDCCIKAAKVIIAAQRALRDIFDAADRMYNCLLYCFSSAVVLLVDNFHRLSAPGAMNGTADLDAQRHEALDVLNMLRREANTSMIAQAGTKVLEGLLNEEGKRRTGRGLPPPGEDFTRNNTPDNDAPTLREVVERIASVSQPKAVQTGSIASGTSASGSPTTAFPPKPLTSPRSTTFPPAPLPPQYAIPATSEPGPSTSIARMPAVNLDLPPTQSFTNAGGFGDSLMSGDESESLLRSLGFFEVSGNIMPSLNDGSDGTGYSNMLGGNAGMAQDLSWLDGLGEW